MRFRLKFVTYSLAKDWHLWNSKSAGTHCCTCMGTADLSQINSFLSPLGNPRAPSSPSPPPDTVTPDSEGLLGGPRTSSLRTPGPSCTCCGYHNRHRTDCVVGGSCCRSPRALGPLECQKPSAWGLHLLSSQPPPMSTYCIPQHVTRCQRYPNK